MRYLDSGKIIVDDLDELREIVKAKDIDLSLIDIKESGLTSLSYLFEDIEEINGSIEDWDISNIKNLYATFYNTSFQPNLSKWDVSNIECIDFIFRGSLFNGDISNWNFKKLRSAEYAFRYSKFNGDISSWNMSTVESIEHMFNNSKFNGDISKWDVSKVQEFKYTFAECDFDGDISQWKFNKYANCRNIIYDNFNFVKKYNNRNYILDDSEVFLSWFKKNKENMYEIHHNINKETKVEIDDYLDSFILNNDIIKD